MEYNLNNIHEKGLRGPKHPTFEDQFYLQNERKLRFHKFLQFHAGKHMTLPETDLAHKKVWFYSNLTLNNIFR